MDPVIRSLRAQLASHVSWANTPDPASRTAKARAAHDSKFVQQARELHPGASDERINAVAANLRSAHYARLGLASALARRRKSAGKAAAA